MLVLVPRVSPFCLGNDNTTDVNTVRRAGCTAGSGLGGARARAARPNTLTPARCTPQHARARTLLAPARPHSRARWHGPAPVQGLKALAPPERTSGGQGSERATPQSPWAARPQSTSPVPGSAARALGSQDGRSSAGSTAASTPEARKLKSQGSGGGSWSKLKNVFRG